MILNYLIRNILILYIGTSIRYIIKRYICRDKHIKFKELLQGSKFKKNSDDVNADSVMNEFVNRLYAFAIILIVILSSVLLKKSCVSNTDIQEQRIDTTYSLKNGYLLRKFAEDDSLLIYSLEKDDFRKAIVKQKRFKDEAGVDIRYDDNYTGLDFEKYFLISHKLALTEESYLIFDKENGKNVFDGYDCFISNVEELYENNDGLLLCVCRSKKDDVNKLFLCDLTKGVFQELYWTEFSSSGTDRMPVDVADCFELQKTEGDSVVIIYSDDNQYIQKKIARE